MKKLYVAGYFNTTNCENDFTWFISEEGEQQKTFEKTVCEEWGVDDVKDVIDEDTDPDIYQVDDDMIRQVELC